MRRFDWLNTDEDLLALTERVGFLPFFCCGIEGFSIEECTPRRLWFSDTEDGPWEWKGPAVRSKRVLYGRFYRGRMGYVSRAWAPDFLNYRRDGYDLDARYDDGLMPRKDKDVYDVLVSSGSLLTIELKTKLRRTARGAAGLDGSLARLQMGGYVCISDFEYRRSRKGEPYGWGLARLTVPENVLGYGEARSAYTRSPAESKARILAQLKNVLPDAEENELLKILG